MENLMTNIKTPPWASTPKPDGIDPGSTVAEKTAVYIGRASFRMASANQVSEVAGAVPGVPIDGSGLTEEHVILTPPGNPAGVASSPTIEVTVIPDSADGEPAAVWAAVDAVLGSDGAPAVDTAETAGTSPYGDIGSADVAARLAEMLEAPDGPETSEALSPDIDGEPAPIMVRRGVRKAAGVSRRRSRLWMVGVALAAGGVVALSTEAVIRVPARTAAVTKLVARPPAHAPAMPIGGDVTAHVENRPGSHPLVALSTVELWGPRSGSDSESAATTHASTVGVSERTHRPHSTPLAKRSTPAQGPTAEKNHTGHPSSVLSAHDVAHSGRPAKVTRGAANWVDPFATTTATSRPAPRAIGKARPSAPPGNATPKGNVAAAAAKRTAWVDPFAN